MSAPEIPGLQALSPWARTIVLAWYEAGVTDGIPLGRRQVEDELAAEWAQLRADVLPVTQRRPFDQLADRRGQHERAERQRAILRERGIA